MKIKRLCLGLISLVLLGGCSSAKLLNSANNNQIKSALENLKEKQAESEKAVEPEKSVDAESKAEPESPVSSQRNLPAAVNSTDTVKQGEIPLKNENPKPEGPTQKDYFFELLPGEWNGYIGDGDVFRLSVAPDMTFNYQYSNGLGEGEYSGVVIPEWIYRNDKTSAPDQLIFEVESGSDSAKGGCFALDFTDLQGMLHMYLEPVKAGSREYDDEDTMFGILALDGGFFLSRNVEISPINDIPLKGETFYAKYWGGEYYTTNELWLERVEYDVNGKFFVSKKNIAIKYKMSDPSLTLFDLDVEWQAVYLIDTDSNGNILYIASVDEGEFILTRSHFEASVDEIWDILENETTEFNELINQGFESYISQEFSEIDGRICYDCLVGTTSWPDKYEKVFDIEAHFSVDVVMRKAYKYDDGSQSWERLN